MKKCPNCNANIPDGAQYCTSCGAKYTDVNRCPSCGQSLTPNAKFCTKCGKRIDGTKTIVTVKSSKNKTIVINCVIAVSAMLLGISIYLAIFNHKTNRNLPNDVAGNMDSLEISLDTSSVEVAVEKTDVVKNYAYESPDYMLFDVYGKVKSVRYSGDLTYTVLYKLGIYDNSTIKFSSSGQWNNVMDCYDIDWEEENIVPSEVIKRDGKGRITSMTFNVALPPFSSEITYSGNSVSEIQLDGTAGYSVLKFNLSDGVKEGEVGSISLSTVCYGSYDNGENDNLSVINNNIDSHGNWTSRTYKSSKGSVNVSRSITYY